MWLIGEAAALVARTAAPGSVRLAARKAGKTRADESSLNAEAVCNSGARRGGRAPVAIPAGGVRRALAAPLHIMYQRVVLSSSATRAPRTVAASVGNV